MLEIRVASICTKRASLRTVSIWSCWLFRRNDEASMLSRFALFLSDVVVDFPRVFFAAYTVLNLDTG